MTDARNRNAQPGDRPELLDRALGDDELRLVDVLLEELCSAETGATSLPVLRQRHQPWLAAAVLLFGISVAVGVAVLTRSTGHPAQEPAPSPVPRPAPRPAPPVAVPPVGIERWRDSYIESGEAPSRSHDLGLLTRWATVSPSAAPRLPRDPRNNSFDAHRGSVVVHHPSTPTSTGLTAERTPELPPAMALLHDLLPANAHRTNVLRGEVRDAASLAEQPAQLLSLRCDADAELLLAQSLWRFSSLRRLELGELLDDTIANALSRTPLVELEAGCRGLTDAGIVALARVPSLRSLVLWGDLRPLSGSGFTALGQLETLRIGAPLPPALGTARAPTMLRHVLQLTHLHELQLVLTESAPDAADGHSMLFSSLAKMRALRRLGITSLSGSLSSLVRGVATLPLERLRLDGEALAAADVDALGAMHTLLELDLGNAWFHAPADAVAALGRLGNLQRLTLGTTNLPFDFRAALGAALPHCTICTDHLTVDPAGRQQLRRTGMRHAR
jgi:hypothetical protein